MPADYKKYLLSDAWKQIRKKVVVRDNLKCTKCGNTRHLQVHHKTYEHIFNENEHLNDLVTLCYKCHNEVSIKRAHPICGEFLKPSDTTIEFSIPLYFKYWDAVCCNLEVSTNIIIVREPQMKAIRAIQEFTKVCGCSKSAAYKFIKECKTKNYISRFGINNKRMYVAVGKSSSVTGELIRFVCKHLDDNGIIVSDKIIAMNQLL